VGTGFAAGHRDPSRAGKVGIMSLSCCVFSLRWLRFDETMRDFSPADSPADMKTSAIEISRVLGLALPRNMRRARRGTLPFVPAHPRLRARACRGRAFRPLRVWGPRLRGDERSMPHGLRYLFDCQTAQSAWVEMQKAKEYRPLFGRWAGGRPQSLSLRSPEIEGDGAPTRRSDPGSPGSARRCVASGRARLAGPWA